MQARGAGRDDGDVGALESVADRDMAGDHVDDGSRHKKWGNTTGTARCVFGVGGLNHGQAAYARADHTTDAGGLFLAQGLAGFQPRVGHRLAGSGDAVMDEGIHGPCLFGTHVRLDIKTAHLACDLAGEGAGIKFGNSVNTGLTRQEPRPRLLHRVADRADAAQPRYNYAAARHKTTFMVAIG